MYGKLNKVKLFLYIFVLIFSLCSCKTSNTSKKQKSDDASSSTDTTTTTTVTDSSDNTTTTTTTEDTYTEENYDARIIDSLGVNLCGGIFKINKECEEGWTRKLIGCYANILSQDTDEFHQKASEYISQGYNNRIFCYTSDSGDREAISLIKYDSDGAHQVIFIQK